MLRDLFSFLNVELVFGFHIVMFRQFLSCGVPGHKGPVPSKNLEARIPFKI